jgi:hypothetical protein
MGLNLYLQRPDGTEHPDWDSSKFAGDRDVFNAITDMGVIYHQPFDLYEPLLRPVDLGTLDEIKWPEFNAERWEQLCRILRDEPDYWIAASY